VNVDLVPINTNQNTKMMTQETEEAIIGSTFLRRQERMESNT
jgi:hypothetical protein